MTSSRVAVLVRTGHTFYGYLVRRTWRTVVLFLQDGARVEIRRGSVVAFSTMPAETAEPNRG